ncbi:hypothetical protein D3C76_668100 [compost metagenome]
MMLHHSERPVPSAGSVRVTNRAETAPSGAVIRPVFVLNPVLAAGTANAVK